MIAPCASASRSRRFRSGSGTGWFGARLVADSEEWEPSRTERLGSSRLTLAAGENRRETTQVAASLRNKSGRPGFVKILGPLLPPALRFLPALS